MIFADASNFVASANAGLTPVNGMYLLYTQDRTTPIPPASGATISGGRLSTVVETVNTSAAELGLCRMPAMLTAATSGGTVISGGSFVAGGSYTFYGNTGACNNVCGLPFSAGVYARAVMLVNLDRGSVQSNAYMYDTGLNYDELTTPIIAPANGAITLIEKVEL